MVNFAAFVFALSVASVHAAPFTKRIAQVIADSTTKWEAACDAAGGGEQCNPTAVNAFGTLLAAAGPCDQQNAADTMIDLAKQLNNDPNMIKFAQIFAQQPRNSPNSLSVPYCQQAPKNTELNGLFQCQYQGDDKQNFVGGLKVGQAGTIPFGMTSPVSPAGSCPANPSGPIADGTQLTDITSDPGVGGSSSTGASAGSSSKSTATAAVSGSSAVETPSAASSAAPSLASPSLICDPDDEDGDDGEDTTETASATATSAAAASTASASSSGGFVLSNGKAAQALNAQFQSLTADSSCTEGEDACIGTGFAQCVSGKFVVTDCGSAAGLTCAALPLVNKAGTSITCTTPSDAVARIAATGATGGLTGSSN